VIANSSGKKIAILVETPQPMPWDRIATSAVSLSATANARPKVISRAALLKASVRTAATAPAFELLASPDGSRMLLFPAGFHSNSNLTFAAGSYNLTLAFDGDGSSSNTSTYSVQGTAASEAPTMNFTIS
jgi:hypothetical protein